MDSSRVGELTTGTHPILACNVHSAKNKKKIQIVLRSMKTHSQANKPQKGMILLIKTTSGSTKHCRYETIMNYINVRSKRKKATTENESFFIFRDRTPVQPYQLRRVLRRCLRLIGLQDHLYDIHSLRIGRSTDLMKIGICVDKIKHFGRWRSNAVYDYFC